MSEKKLLKEKDLKLHKENFASDQDVRWCPGCGDYAILAQMKKVLPELGIPRARIVFVSGIGCSSRFPYYINSYGLHTIHGRAPTIATGIKLANPHLSVWLITGDGDGLSIGGNHLIHLFRRNIDLNVILFNNQIYGLTKGQYSPTSPMGKITKTTPYGSLDAPFNPIAVALSAGASFVARTIDRDTKHMAEILRRAALHKGCSFVEVYQNCNIFNDGVFKMFTDSETKPDHVLYLEEGKPLVYGKERNMGLRLNGLEIVKFTLDHQNGEEQEMLIHEEKSTHDAYAQLLARMNQDPHLPTPVGVFRDIERETYDEQFHRQMEYVTQKKGNGDLKQLFITGDTWRVD